MSPARAQAAARAGGSPSPAPRRVKVAPVREAPVRPGRLAGVVATVRSGNALGRVGTLAAVALFACVFGVIVFQTLLVQGQARLDALDKRAATEDLRSRELHRQLADLDAPGRIVGVARDKLGMVAPTNVGFLVPAPDDDAKSAWVASAVPAPPPAPTTTVPAKKATTPTTAAAKTTPTTAAAKKTTPTTTAPKKTTPTTTTKTTKP